ncbi:antiviral RADAR system adenosine triphosphatase RdrA [Photobacterium damselae]|uniref:antiviral RADAR system adenosine triphosphatase RdrA n=1 Tax=Photobacterium damselae TaxID=38293 RepID=UPI004069519A
MSQNKIYIPLNAGESAVLPDANTLLPREEVYKPLAQMIKEAVDKANSATNRTLNELREHNAISIDGARGTGKTAVLVNLKSYLKNEDVLKEVHILDPVDPTLLEDGESLFLHIIVAAVLHDNDVKEAQRKEPYKARSLNQTLEKLAQSLESVETAKERHGMDKVRAMYSNKYLADSVQDFFREVLGLLDKKLLILPIDDVDTSLNRAFENLEIVRRYLATPHVLPIVCGDRELYNDVTWRDFHGRLTKDSNYDCEEAYEKAIELAAEYQRKILPFPRRLSMPLVSKYWQQDNIYLGNEKNEVMPLRNFIAWMETFLSGPVNGLEGSKLTLPIPSIRALTQLVRHSSDLIPNLPESIRSAKNELDVRKKWQMLSDEQDVMQLCEKKAMVQRMADYFCYEPKAGAVYLVLLAKQYWNTVADSDSSNQRGSIFDTPLFQPLTQVRSNFELFDKVDDLSSWPALLKDRLPEEWLTGIKLHKTILPYPVAEVGVNSSKKWNYNKEIQAQDFKIDQKNKAGFLIALLAQSNFYTNAKQTMLLNIGRVFELLIASIVGPLSAEDIHAIIGRAPFFSTAALAPTKTITIKESKSSNATDEESEETQSEEFDLNSIVKELHEEIEEWREKYVVNNIDLSPWLVYKVFNKLYSSQAASAEYLPNGMKNIGTALNMVAHSFYLTWFAFGSFEKGVLFGLPNVVTTTNINRENLKNYKSNDQYNVNVKPIIDASLNQDKNLMAVSVVLEHHPLKIWVDDVIKLDWPKDEPSKTSKTTKKETVKRETAAQWLAKKLNITTAQAIKVTDVMKILSTKDRDECQKLLDEMLEKFTTESKARTALQKAVNTLHPEPF